MTVTSSSCIPSFPPDGLDEPHIYQSLSCFVFLFYSWVHVRACTYVDQAVLPCISSVPTSFEICPEKTYPRNLCIYTFDMPELATKPKARGTRKPMYSDTVLPVNGHNPPLALVRGHMQGTPVALCYCFFSFIHHTWYTAPARTALWIGALES